MKIKIDSLTNMCEASLFHKIEHYQTMTKEIRRYLNRIFFLYGNVTIPNIQRKFKFSYEESKKLHDEYKKNEGIKWQ